MKLYEKIIIFVLLLLILNSKTYAQTKFTEKEPAFLYELSYIGDMVYNANGGIKTGYSYLAMANIAFSFDTEKANLWKGGLFCINAANTHGGEPSSTLIGDFQGVSNIEAGNLSYMHEFWFKQTLKKISLTIGLQDLNAEYATSDLGSLYINSSFGIHSTIADNVPSPIFPLTRLGASISWDINNQFTFKAALYDGLRNDYEHNDYNLNWNIQTDGGVLYVAELQYSSNFFRNSFGSYKIGCYNHHHKTNIVTDSTISHNNMGFYLVADQMLYTHANRNGGVGVFAQLGLSSPEMNNHFCYVGCGFNYIGISDKRANDEIGISVAHTRFKTNTTGNETVIELSYKAKLGKHLNIQPDFQYVINPSGTDVQLNNAFVGILRFGISL